MIEEMATTIGIWVMGFGAFAIGYYVWMFFYKIYEEETARKQYEGYMERCGEQTKSISEMLDEIENSIKEEKEK
jgi:hypothetical protein